MVGEGARLLALERGALLGECRRLSGLVEEALARVEEIDRVLGVGE